MQRNFIGRLRCGFEAVHQLLRNIFDGPANRCFWQFRERDPSIAVPCKLGIEWDGPEAGDLQARCGVEGFW
jgi:hypothetical protein